MIFKLDIVHAHHLSYIWKNVEWIRIILILHLLAIVLMKTVGWLSNVRLIGLNRFGSSSMNCACTKALGWRCLATSMYISPLLITRLLLFCATNLLRSIISIASIRIIASPGLRQRFLKAEFWARLSGVTPMGSEWANPRAPGLRGHPGAPLTLVFQLRLPPRLPFQKGAPFQHFFHSLVAKFP